MATRTFLIRISTCSHFHFQALLDQINHHRPHTHRQRDPEKTPEAVCPVDQDKGILQQGNLLELQSE